MIQLSSADRLAFYKRTVVSVGLFVLLLSFAANIFFLTTRNSTKTPEKGIFHPSNNAESLLMGAVAYGKVQRGFPEKTQKKSGTSALLPVAAYIVPEGMVSQMNGALPLFRDQGVPLDDSEVERLFSRLGVMMNWRELQLLPMQARWRTADRTMDLTLDIERRSLTITRSGLFNPSSEGRAEDDTVLAIARDFAVSLGIDLAPLGTPRIVERSNEPGGPLKTYVIWSMSFNNVPLVDINTEPVPAVQIQVGRLARKALSMTVTLLRPDKMSQSAYSPSSKEIIFSTLLGGGIIPIARDLKGTKTNAVYTSLSPAYVLLLGDRDYPTYLAPILIAHFKQGSVFGRTFVPALNPDQFTWKVPEKIVPPPVVATGSIKKPSVLTGAVMTGTGSLTKPSLATGAVKTGTGSR